MSSILQCSLLVLSLSTYILVPSFVRSVHPSPLVLSSSHGSTIALTCVLRPTRSLLLCVCAKPRGQCRHELHALLRVPLVHSLHRSDVMQILSQAEFVPDGEVRGKVVHQPAECPRLCATNVQHPSRFLEYSVHVIRR